jgi:hypothetical protein
MTFSQVQKPKGIRESSNSPRDLLTYQVTNESDKRWIYGRIIGFNDNECIIKLDEVFRTKGKNYSLETVRAKPGRLKNFYERNGRRVRIPFKLMRRYAERHSNEIKSREEADQLD